MSTHNLFNHANTCAIRHVQFARDKSNSVATAISTGAQLVGLLIGVKKKGGGSFSHNYLCFESKYLINAFMGLHRKNKNTCIRELLLILTQATNGDLNTHNKALSKIRLCLFKLKGQ